MNEITYDNNNKICAIGDMCMGTVFYYEGNKPKREMVKINKLREK